MSHKKHNLQLSLTNQHPQSNFKKPSLRIKSKAIGNKVLHFPNLDPQTITKDTIFGYRHVKTGNYITSLHQERSRTLGPVSLTEILPFYAQNITLEAGVDIYYQPQICGTNLSLALPTRMPDFLGYGVTNPQGNNLQLKSALIENVRLMNQGDENIQIAYWKEVKKQLPHQFGGDPLVIGKVEGSLFNYLKIADNQPSSFQKINPQLLQPGDIFKILSYHGDQLALEYSSERDRNFLVSNTEVGSPSGVLLIVEDNQSGAVKFKPLGMSGFPFVFFRIPWTFPPSNGSYEIYNESRKIKIYRESANYFSYDNPTSITDAFLFDFYKLVG